MEETNTKISIYKYPAIYSSTQYFRYMNELAKKLESDEEILDKHPTSENQMAYKTNLLIYHWLHINGTVMNGALAESKLDYQKDGWFIWLQTFDFTVSGKPFMDNDEKFTYCFDKFFDDNFLSIDYGGRYWMETINNYKNGQYYSCVCGLFPLIEFFQKRISKFDGKSIFNIKKSLKESQVKDLSGYKNYFEKFESNLNEFLTKNVYAVSTEMDEEPKFICRNRVLHGIFTRDINKTDCLKLFCIVKSMVEFLNWLHSLEEIRRLSAELKQK